eukprot:Trichotokara_eunicae@DN4566_c1_g1_i4.p1
MMGVRSPPFHPHTAPPPPRDFNDQPSDRMGWRREPPVGLDPPSGMSKPPPGFGGRDMPLNGPSRSGDLAVYREKARASFHEKRSREERPYEEVMRAIPSDTRRRDFGSPGGNPDGRRENEDYRSHFPVPPPPLPRVLGGPTDMRGDMRGVQQQHQMPPPPGHVRYYR